MFDKIFMVGNAHIDPTWLWRWQDGYETVRSTFRSALDRMKEYPEFVFTSACAVYYEWMQKCEPEMFEEIRRRVKEGRWRIVGGWYLQPDCNIPSGESFARHALISQDYFLKNFGIMARTGYNVDSFGHTGTLPKILAKSGLKRYVYMRPGSHERSYSGGCTFVWKTQTGESVIAFRIPTGYGTDGGEEGIRRQIGECLRHRDENSGMMCFYGVGNHGGGPTKKNIEGILAARKDCEAQLIFGDPDTYFDRVDPADLPVETGDLFHHASGCYSAHSGIKQLNRRSENALACAEKWAALAMLNTGAPDRGEELTKAWKKVLYNQFHDVMAGTSLKQAYEDSTADFGYALSAAADISNETMQRIASRMDVPFIEGAQPFVVFNDHSFEAEAPVCIDIGWNADDFTLYDERMQPVAMQQLTPSGAVWGRSRMCFMAKVPPLGARRYVIVPEKHDVPAVDPDVSILENEFVKVRFDPETGEICSYFDKTLGRELLKRPCETRIFADDSDTWSHGKFVFDGECRLADRVEIEVLDEGRVRRTIKTVQHYGASTVRRDYTLYRAARQLYVDTTVDWHETWQCLKFAYPLNITSPRVTAQEPFGYAERDSIPEGQECPMQEWVDLRGDEAGLAVINNGKYSYDAHDGTLCITVLRSPYYANHTPFVVKPGMDFPVMDQGEQRFKLVLSSHGSRLPAAELEKTALLVNAPLTLLPEYAHKGDLPGCVSFAALDAQSAVIDAFKTALDGSGDIVVHLHETARCAGQAVLRIGEHSLKFDLKPGELKIFRFRPADGSFTETDLLEK